MKKLILAACFIFSFLISNAQVKVHSSPISGSVSLGSTSAPINITGLKLQVYGGALFSTATSGTNSAALIKGANGYSSATTPDYTWNGDDNTGLFHPSAGDIIGFTTSGSERMRITSGGLVGIGTTSPSAALSVGGAGGSTTEGYFYNSLTTGGLALYGEMPTGTSGNNYGVVGTVPSGNSNGYGVQGNASNASVQTGGLAIGVYGISGNAAQYNFAVWGRLNGTKTGAGIYGSLGAYTYIPWKYAGYFDGNIRMTTDSAIKTTTNTWFTSSDMRLKKDIASFNDGLNVIRQINPVTYKFTGVGGLPSTTVNIGVLAQDVQPIAPYCVGTTRTAMKQSEAANFGSDVVETFQDSTNGTMAIVKTLTFNTHGLFYAMLNSIKELDLSVTDIQNRLNNPTSSLKTTQNQGSAKDADKNILQLKADNVSLKKENEMLKQEIENIKQRLSKLETK